MKALFVLTVGLLFSASAFAAPAHVIILRHAEKPADKNDGTLSDRGEQRAAALPQYLKEEIFPTYGTPATIYAFRSKKDGKEYRGAQTVTPLAADLHKIVDENFKKGEEKELVDYIVKNYNSEQTVLICWEHKAIKDILEAFGMKNAPKWPKDKFDRTLIVDLDKDGDFVKLENLPQNLLPGDTKD